MRAAITALLLCALAAAGCGASRPEAPAPALPAGARVADFPKAAPGETLAGLQDGLPEGPIFQPAVSLLQQGENRFSFALFDLARTPLSGAEVMLYVARPDGTRVRGPFPARSESVAVEGAFASRTTLDDPESARSIYVADVPFRRDGAASVVALVRMDGRVMRTEAAAMRVGAEGATPPAVGERAVVTTTETVASAGGDLSKIDTRLPPAPELHRDDLRDVLGRKPVVITFATPQLCQSRVCGPVVDVVLQAKAKAGDGVAFIHQEIFRDNDVAKGVRPPVAAWHLATEPWTFVVDRGGVVRARFEGPMSVGELERAIAEVR